MSQARPSSRLQLQIQALMLYSLSTACFYIETHISALKHLLHSLLPVQIPLDTEMRLQTALFLRQGVAGVNDS
mgnify:CR=1 FL=1